MNVNLLVWNESSSVQKQAVAFQATQVWKEKENPKKNWKFFPFLKPVL